MSRNEEDSQEPNKESEDERRTTRNDRRENSSDRRVADRVVVDAQPRRVLEKRRTP